MHNTQRTTHNPQNPQVVPKSTRIPRMRERDAPKLFAFDGGQQGTVYVEVWRCRAHDRKPVLDVVWCRDDGSPRGIAAVPSGVAMVPLRASSNSKLDGR